MTVDLSFRPLSYWPESLDQEKLLGRIKGMARRVEARRILNNEGFRGLTQFLGRDELSDQEREGWSKIHPSLMGGEYLPGPDNGVVEIVRISLRSVTGDQISVRAIRGESNIRYSIVDEYESNFDQPFYETDNELSLKELIFLLDGSEIKGDIYEGGLVESQWNAMFDYLNDVEEALSSVRLESAFYPEVAKHYQEASKAWAMLHHEDEGEDEND